MSSLKKKVFGAFLWDYSGKIAGQFTGLAVGIILARLLTPEDFGLVGMAMVFIGLSEIFANLGLSAALIQKKDPREEHFSSSFYLNVAASFLLTAIMFFAAPLIGRFYKRPDLVNIVRVLSLNFLLSGFTIVQDAWLRKKMKFGILTRSKLAGSIMGGLIGITMAVKGFGVWSLVVQTLATRFFNSVQLWIASSWKPKIIFAFGALKELWAYGFHMFLAGMLDTFYGQLDSLIIGKIFSARDLGLYSRAKSLNRFVIRYSSESIGSVTFPVMSDMQHDRDRLVNFTLKIESLVAFSAFGLLGLLYVTSRPLIIVLLGYKWEGAVEIFKLLALSGFVYPISAATLSMLRAQGDSRLFFKLEVLKKVIGGTGLVIGFLFGLKGYLISLIVTGSINTLLNMYYSGRNLNVSLHEQLANIYKYLLIAVLAALMSACLPIGNLIMILQLIILSAVFSIVYLSANYLLKTMGMQMLASKLHLVKIRK